MSELTLNGTARANRAGALTSSVMQLPWAAALAGGLVAFLAFSHGGYWPGSWSWATLAALTALMLIGAFGVCRVTRLETVFLAGILGLAVWTAVSAVWSSGSGALFEAQRIAMYAFVAAVVVFGDRRDRTTFALGALLAAIVGVSGYSLLERLFPDRLGVYDSVAAYRLSGPIGYWNGLSIVSVIGLILAIGFACRARTMLVRALASASTVVLIATLYFTFGRAAWLALAFGLLAAIVLDPRRVQMIAHSLALLPAASAAVLLSSHSPALTHRFSPAAAAAADGHRLAVAVLVLAACAAAANVGATVIERTIDVPRIVTHGFTAATGVVALGAIAVLFIHYGGPIKLAREAYDSFDSPPVPLRSDLNQRYFSLSSNWRVDMWRSAWSDFAHHQVVGSGAASYEDWWNRYRPAPLQVRNAHSLYLETLAELGPIGLIFLVVAFATPMVAAVRARSSPLVPVGAGAFVAFVLHAGVDWDWQLGGVTAAACVCGAALVLAARNDDAVWTFTPRVRMAFVVTLAVLLVGAGFLFVGNTALSRAEISAANADYPASETQARKATRWMSWNADAWRVLGEAQLADRDPAAVSSLRKAIGRDQSNWLTWFDLAAATSGTEHAQAIARARALNPLSPEIRELARG